MRCCLATKEEGNGAKLPASTHGLRTNTQSGSGGRSRFDCSCWSVSPQSGQSCCIGRRRVQRRVQQMSRRVPVSSTCIEVQLKRLDYLQLPIMECATSCCSVWATPATLTSSPSSGVKVRVANAGSCCTRRRLSGCRPRPEQLQHQMRRELHISAQAEYGMLCVHQRKQRHAFAWTEEFWPWGTGHS
jgi:hypothetical protein